MTAALAALCGILLLMVLAWMLYQRRALSPAQRLWRRYCARLKRYGPERAKWEGPLDFARRVARENPELGRLTGEAARHFADLHYGNGKPEQLLELKNCLRQLKQRSLPS